MSITYFKFEVPRKPESKNSDPRPWCLAPFPSYCSQLTLGREVVWRKKIYYQFHNLPIVSENCTPDSALAGYKPSHLFQHPTHRCDECNSHWSPKGYLWSQLEMPSPCSELPNSIAVGQKNHFSLVPIVALPSSGKSWHHSLQSYAELREYHS